MVMETVEFAAGPHWSAVLFITLFKPKFLFMDTTNYPNAPVERQEQGKNVKNIVIAVLAFAFLGSVVYAVVNNNNKAHVIEQQQTQIAKVSDEKGDVQKSFDQSLVRLDSMASLSNGLKNKLSV